MNARRLFLTVAALLLGFATPAIQRAEPPAEAAPAAPGKVFILPIRGDIMPPMTYVVRRGVKEAMDAQAGTLVIDLETNGGRVDVTEEILGILGRFPGRTVTFVNAKAFSAGAFIAFGTQEIWMAPESVIGAAAPMAMGPGGMPVELPATVEAKMNSGLKALIRTRAEKYGHNFAVIEAMMDPDKELKVGDEVLNAKGDILTLTNNEAERKFGEPPQPLVSRGTVASLEALLDRLGAPADGRVQIQPTGVERFGFWLNAISPLLLALGIVGVYMEFKTPGFGVPGVVAICAFALYFLGGYLAGLSGMEWILVFALGLALVAVELFFFPGTILVGATGATLMFVALVMAAVDHYPGMPAVPAVGALRLPVQNLVVAALLTLGLGWAAMKILPHTPMQRLAVSRGTSGTQTERAIAEAQARELGLTGVAISPLRPGGKAQFGDLLLDVVTQGELIPPGSPVRVIGHRGHEALVALAG
ncbi:MAG: NfeD family protein [Limisphaerales bacterium]